MAIKVIDSIPGRQEKISQRQMVRRDIDEAIQKGIGLFEFEGEDYSYKSLIQTAREVAQSMLHEKVTMIQRRFRQDNLTDDERRIKGFYLPAKSYWEYKGMWISILSRKGETRPRVFCRIEDCKELEAKVNEDMWISLNEARGEQKIVNNKWVFTKRSN